MVQVCCRVQPACYTTGTTANQKLECTQAALEQGIFLSVLQQGAAFGE